MNDLMKLLDGKKSYIVLILAGVGLIMQQKGIVIPEVAWQVLGLLGLGAVRSTINKLISK